LKPSLFDCVRAFAIINRSARRIASIALRSVAAPIALRRVTSDVRVFNQVFVLGRYDHPRQSQQWSWLEKPCACISADGGRQVFVDCGANIGLSTVFFKNLHPAASVGAVEPERRNFEILRRSCAPSPDIVPIQAGISDRNGTVAISNPDAKGSAFRVTPVKPNGAGGIPAITVDDAIRALPGGIP
jgi:FkbM family methyltransferase